MAILNLANSESFYILRLLKEAKICNFRKFVKNGCIWATQWPTSIGLKIKFDPSLDRSWHKLFWIKKGHGPKNPPTGCNFCPKLKPHVGRSAKTNWQQFRPFIKKSMPTSTPCSSEASLTYYITTKKPNSFVCFLEESLARKKRYEIIWPLEFEKKIVLVV